ncbi:hypothetical protein [uncultured Paraglaciecola sp.]|uniref:hypothetical protein n=1 Tax=uncultured Paraglaciecola sp. TaxID=1765024 RepID=UPI002625800F|nr:hypothetical protein [uncultured Paraglaciecola sp.]
MSISVFLAVLFYVLGVCMHLKLADNVMYLTGVKSTKPIRWCMALGWPLLVLFYF